MQIINQELEFYNVKLQDIEDIRLIDKFIFKDEHKVYEGKITLSRKKENLDFIVQIPLDYPFKEIKFVSQSLKGFPHQNYDGSICLNTPFVNHIYTRLDLDLDKLRNWVKEYVEQENIDSNYEYIAGNMSSKVDFLFQEGLLVSERFSKNTFGELSYSVLNDNRTLNKKPTSISVICQSIGNLNNEWSSNYEKLEKYNGLWVYLEQEPVYERKSRIKTWTDLHSILPKDFYKYFADFCKKTAKHKLGMPLFRDYIFLAIGYDIPTLEGNKEVHWDLLLLNKSMFTRRGNIADKILENLSNEILWEQTYNIDYKRFFGRGALVENIINKKILVIGVGAIGSSLCEILVRGGVKNITISDIDTIEAGNICRSVYLFTDVGKSKSVELRNTLDKISPYVNVEVLNSLSPLSNKSEQYIELEETINNYDIIFDCAANTALTQMLSDMNIESLIIYFSITNMAKEMVCVSNTDSISIIERRNQMLYSLNGIKEPEFREGTGCWHPTFEAAYFDINQLLNYNIKKINSQMREGMYVNTFYSFFRNERIESTEDISFEQKELGLKLKIESHCLDSIYGLVWSQYPKEFGGVLVGNYINDFKEVIISDIIYPNSFVSSLNTFSPDNLDLNEQLKTIWQEYDGKVVYIGDWHSHPNGNDKYSKTDFRSIEKVANFSSVNTHNPILMIVAFSENYFVPSFYVYNKGKLHKYDRVDNYD